ncbi:PAS domain S-box protein [Halomonas salinarum]|uniref:PAS domain S-box protein n=1 Tax=Halomonas salinarum TaxID=1158993 RepID=UPI00143ABAB6|nr:PAS domain S-box protein [Halomonas salinarum]
MSPPGKKEEHGQRAGDVTDAHRIQQLQAELEHTRHERDLWQQEAEQIFAEMFRHNTAPKLLIEPDSGQIVDANDSALAFYGYSRSAIEQLNIRDINLLDEAALQQELHLAHREERRFFRFQHRLASGECRDVEVYSGPIMLGGRPLLHSIIHDVTERTRAEAELAAKKEEYRDLVEQHPQFVMRFLPDTTLLFLNSPLANLLGKTPQALMGQRWIDLLPTLEHKAITDHLAGFTEETPIRAFENLVADSQGEKRWVHWTNRAFFDECGTPTAFQSVGIDITQRRQLEQEHRRLSEIIEASPDLISMADTEARPFYYNPAGRKMMAGAQGSIFLDEHIVHKHLTDIWQHLRHNAMPQALSKDYWQGEGNIRNTQDKEVPVRQTLIAHRTPQGAVTHFSTIMHDLTNQKALEAEHRLMATTFHTGQGVMIVNRERVIERVNDAFTAITGYGPADVVGRSPQLLQSGQHDETFYQRIEFSLSISGYWEGEYWYRHRSGEIAPLWQSIATLKDAQGEIEHFVHIFHDIRQQKTLEKELQHLAEHDHLTGTCNRTRLYRLLSQSMKELERHDTPFSLVMLDIDRFKRINDNFGHDVGDQVLKALTDIITRQLRESDEVGRWGGEEFMVLASHTHLEGALTLAERIRGTVEATPFEGIGGLTISLGVAEIHRDMTLAQAEKAVDNALYHAKRRGRNRVEEAPGGAEDSTEDPFNSAWRK